MFNQGGGVALEMLGLTMETSYVFLFVRRTNISCFNKYQPNQTSVSTIMKIMECVMILLLWQIFGARLWFTYLSAKMPHTVSIFSESCLLRTNTSNKNVSYTMYENSNLIIKLDALHTRGYLMSSLKKFLLARLKKILRDESVNYYYYSHVSYR